MVGVIFRMGGGGGGREEGEWEERGGREKGRYETVGEYRKSSEDMISGGKMVYE